MNGSVVTATSGNFSVARSCETRYTPPRSRRISAPPGVGVAARPVKRANRAAASSTSATAMTTSTRPTPLFGVVRQHLNSPFRHHLGLDARNGERRRPGTGLGFDRTLHAHEFAHPEAGPR